jgi:hypothetical protein
MLQQPLNERMRETFERTMLESLIAPQSEDTARLLEKFAGYLWRWSGVTALATHAQTGSALAVIFLRNLAKGAMALDRDAQVLLRQLSKCLLLWSRPGAQASICSEQESSFIQTLRAKQHNDRANAIGGMGHGESEFGGMVAHMRSESKRWLARIEKDPALLSQALVALKGLAEHHQDQRIMELAWATANMLDRITDNTLRITDEFKDVVERAVRLLMFAYVFQVWTIEDEAEYAKTIEDADILASGGELKSLS